MAVLIRLQYEHFFDDRPLEPSDYLAGANRTLLLKAASFFINVIDPSTTNQNTTQIIQNWFSDSNRTIKNHILQRVKSIQNSGIINISSSLKLSELILNSQFGEEETITSQTFELNIFKAYLLLNSELSEIENKQANLPNEENFEEYISALMLVSNFHDGDLSNYNIGEILICQLVKCVEFFQYVQARQDLSSHLAIFLEQYNCTTWQEWAKRILSLTKGIVDSEKKTYLNISVPRDDFYETNVIFLDELCIKDNESFALQDFISLRSAPIVKTDEGQYLVLSNLFLFEKLFKSIQFQFSLNINSSLPPKSRIKNFRADHCDNFSERTLFYGLLQKSFPKKHIHISGDRFKKAGYEAEPDYYVRFQNKIFLFESKDVLLKGDEKHSHDYETLYLALKAKFYKVDKDGKEENKAVLQLVSNVKRIFDKSFNVLDDGYSEANIRIYPVLVIHDRQFDALAVNRIVSRWFRAEIQSLPGKYPVSHVEDLTIMNIDSLILYHEMLLLRGNNRLEKLISDYQSSCRVDIRKCRTRKELESKHFNSFMPFTRYLNNYFQKTTKRSPFKFVTEYGRKIVS